MSKGSERPADPRAQLAGVVLVSVGHMRDEKPLAGTAHAHVARLHDLPSLIHAWVANAK